jgi:hypothetical protein
MTVKLGVRDIEELVRRLTVILGVWVIGLLIATVYLVEIVKPLSAEAMTSFLNSSLTVTVGLLVGVFLAAISAGNIPEPPPGQSPEDYRRGWVYRFLVEFLDLTVGLFATVAGLFGALDPALTVAVLLVTWAIGVIALGSGIFRLVSRPTTANH